MERKQYTKAKIEIVQVQIEDILTSSQMNDTTFDVFEWFNGGRDF